MSSAPIAVSIGNGLAARGSLPTTPVPATGTDPFPLLIDTGTVLTTRAAGGPPVIDNTRLMLLAQPDDGAARGQFDDVAVLFAPLNPVGIDSITAQYGGILAGDLLQRFSLGLDYQAPAITLRRAEPDCSCQLADRPVPSSVDGGAGDGLADPGCNAVMNFTLAGGGKVALGDQIYSYPPTRVTLDACLEAAADPLARGVDCKTGDGSTGRYSAGYETDQPPGIDIRLLVATGFDGMILGASAWDRLRGAGSAQHLLASPSHSLYFAGDSPVPAAVGHIGPGSCAAGNCVSLALVGREGLLGACGELARSRRLRWRAVHKTAPGRAPDCGVSDSDCPPTGVGCLQCLSTSGCGDPNRCNDVNQAAAAYVELPPPLDVYIVDDTAPILQGVNDDVRPALSDVEGVVGTSVLRQLALRIDYPHRRMIARCAGVATDAKLCTTYPRYACAERVNDCGPRGVDSPRLCNAPSAITSLDNICLSAPAP